MCLAILRVCDLFGMVSENVTLSNPKWIKRSRIESPGGDYAIYFLITVGGGPPWSIILFCEIQTRVVVFFCLIPAAGKLSNNFPMVVSIGWWTTSLHQKMVENHHSHPSKNCCLVFQEWMLRLIPHVGSTAPYPGCNHHHQDVFLHFNFATFLNPVC